MKLTLYLITKNCCWGEDIIAPLTKLGDLTVLLYVYTLVSKYVHTSVASDANYAYSGEIQYILKKNFKYL
jgi:hypothetical protein